MALKSSASPFGDCYIVAPRTHHTHTAILLHGRGSTGEDFADDFLTSPLSSGETLPSALPTWRWVFPSSRNLWSTAFQEEMPAWFEAHSLTDITARQGLQVDGIRDAVRHIYAVVEREASKLQGDVGKIFLGGISQGGAVGLWTLLSEPKLMRGLGGFFAASTWLPFAANIDKRHRSKRTADGNASMQEKDPFDGFVEEMMKSTIDQKPGTSSPLVPVFLGHGRDDAYVDIELGRQAAQILERLGMAVRFKEYIGAEQEGHWFRVPEEIQDICDFLRAQGSKAPRLQGK